MKLKTQRTVTGLAGGALLVAWFGMALLMFYVPRLAAHWQETDVTLSPAAGMLLQLSSFARGGVFLTGLLVVVTGTVVAWRPAAARKSCGAKTG